MRPNMNTDNGRSMIEMLGVLAIIGVLSVGGLVGYSKAIERYKVNETINHVTHIVTNTRTLFKTQRDFYSQLGFKTSKNLYDETNKTRAIVESAKLFPEAIIKSGYKNMFGGDIKYYASGKFATNDGKAFIVDFRGIPQEACIELAARDWQSNLGLLVMNVRGSGASSGGINAVSVQDCNTTYKAGYGMVCAKDMPMSIDQAVAACDMEKDNYIVWKFY